MGAINSWVVPFSVRSGDKFYPVSCFLILLEFNLSQALFLLNKSAESFISAASGQMRWHWQP